MTVEERLARMAACRSWERCSAPICGLDVQGEGHQYSNEPFCALILDYLEGREFPQKAAIAANEPKWRAALGDKFLARQLERRVKFREYWAAKAGQEPAKSRCGVEVTPIG